MPKDHLLRLVLFSLLALCAVAPCAAQMPVTVTVTDKRSGKPVTGLPREAFVLSDGKTPQEITSFVGADEPSSVAILLDLSGSVRAGGRLKKLSDALEALSRLVSSGNASNEYTVVTFADEVVTVLDAARGADAAAKALRTLPGAKPGTQSSLFDACWQAVPLLTRGAHAKRILILVTDGVDTYSRAREDDVTRQLKETNVVVYSINVGDAGREEYGGFRPEGVKVLENLSKVSGGLALAPREAKDVGAAVERIAADMRGQYVIGFRPATPPADGKCLKLKTTFTPPAGLTMGAQVLVMRAREEFCAAHADLRKK